jgi:hypothetical protein
MYSSSHVSSYMPPGFRFYPWLGTIESDHLIPYLERQNDCLHSHLNCPSLYSPDLNHPNR